MPAWNRREDSNLREPCSIREGSLSKFEVRRYMVLTEGLEPSTVSLRKNWSAALNYVSKSAGERLAKQKVPVPETAFQQQISVLFVSTYRKLVNGIVAMFKKGLEPYAARNNLVFTRYGINSNPADLLWTKCKSNCKRSKSDCQRF